jgi:hypothetical protein
MRRIVGLICLLFLISGSAYCVMTVTVDYGWEDGNTILGSYLAIEATNVTAPDPVYAGLRSLKLVDGAETGTPEAFVAYVTGLSTGDVVDAGFWAYDTTPGDTPSARIWAHYVKNNDINAYAGSAGGNSTYSDGTGWDELTHSWTVDMGYDRTGLVIVVRTYSEPCDTVWIDNLTVTGPETADIQVPSDIVPEPGLLSLAMAGVLLLFSRRRRV